MNETEIIQARLKNQMLHPQKARSISDVVSHLGALQAQDYAMMKWAVGSRIPGSTETEIEAALNRGEILRTHVLRPTWHVVSALDIHWMLKLTAERIRASFKARDAGLGLSETIINKSKDIVVKALDGNKHLTKEELNVFLNHSSIPTTGYRDYHLLMHAELDGLICSGRTIGNNRSYALLEERAPIKQTISREEALVKLAKTYFSSRCPATIQDFVWWSGLTIGDARKAIEHIKTDFQSQTIGHQTYIIPTSAPPPSPLGDSLHLLPAFDEFIISYRDRSAMLIPDRLKRVVSNNGVFRPTVSLNGRVVGIWKRTLKKNILSIEVSAFESFPPEVIKKLELEAQAYGTFYGFQTTIRIAGIL